MTKHSFDVGAIKTAPEVLRVWEEAGEGLPNAEAWGMAIEAGTNDLIAARLAERAIGYVTIRWSGPHPMEPQFRDLVAKNYEDQMPAAIYALYVNPAHRRLGAGRALMQAAERRILEHPEAANSVVLNVNVENEPAKRLYKSMGYRVLQAVGGQEFELDVPRWNPQNQAFEPNHIKAVAMAKDLKS